jgi:methylmalonyl-CoA/ethylmalonyl-CoA epimerase
LKPKSIEHIGIAVKDLESSIPLYEKLLGVECYAIESVPDQLVKTAFFKVGSVKIELLEPTDELSPIASFLSNKGEGVHHIALAVDDIHEALKDAKSKGFRLIDRVPRPGAEGLRIGFLNPKRTGNVLYEFCSPEEVPE